MPNHDLLYQFPSKVYMLIINIDVLTLWARARAYGNNP